MFNFLGPPGLICESKDLCAPTGCHKDAIVWGLVVDARVAIYVIHVCTSISRVQKALMYLCGFPSVLSRVPLYFTLMCTAEVTLLRMAAPWNVARALQLQP